MRTLGRTLVGAVAWWVVGALPFLLTGLRLPLQNLWATEQAPEAMPHVALPFNQYQLSLLVAITVVGGVAAALTGLLAPPAERRWAVRAALGGAALAATVSIAQTTLVVRGGLEASDRAGLYLAALVTVAVAGSLLGLAVGRLVVLGRPASRAVAVALLSVLLAGWLGGLVVSRGPVTGLGQTLLNAVPWVTALVAGVGLALAPPRSLRTGLGWAGALAVLWVLPPAITAAQYVVGSRVLLATGDVNDWVDASWAVFRAALQPASHPTGPLVLTLLVGLAGLLLPRTALSRPDETSPRTVAP